MIHTPTEVQGLSTLPGHESGGTGYRDAPLNCLQTRVPVHRDARIIEREN
jgi:hypothetical protein